MTIGIELEHPWEREHRVSESRKHLHGLYPSDGNISYLASGSGGDVFVSGTGSDRVAYKVRRIDSQVRPDYWMKEALLLHFLSERGIAPRLISFLPDTSQGARQAVKKRLDIDMQTVDALKSQLGEETLRSFQFLLETRDDSTPANTGVIRMQYVENDVTAYQHMRETNPENIRRQLEEISIFLKSHELYPNDVELVFDSTDNRLKFRDVRGFRVCSQKEKDWDETEFMNGSLDERLLELLANIERRAK